MTKTSEELIKGINFQTLQQQKLTLLNLVDTIENTTQRNDIDGLINLIDSIQDHAVDDLGMIESEVF